MKRRFFITTLLFGFLLFIACKSSLLELCPNLSVVKVENVQYPSCHTTDSATNTRSAEDRDCDCPLAYQDFTLDTNDTGKFSFYREAINVLIHSYSPYNLGFRTAFVNISIEIRHFRFDLDGNKPFLKTIKLLI